MLLGIFQKYHLTVMLLGVPIMLALCSQQFLALSWKIQVLTALLEYFTTR